VLILKKLYTPLSQRIPGKAEENPKKFSQNI